ncbi:MAG: M23 family metallopeptidase [Spirochaetes bacterium]|nr:M23 family metallopeptidase [Spirochaetota bacterium]
MKNLFIIVLITCIAAHAQMPVSPRMPVEVTPIKLTSTFAEYRNDHFHNGIDIAGDRLEIRPLYAGEIIFYTDEFDDPTRSPTGTGNMAVMEHQGKIRTYFYHLTAGTLRREYALLGTNDVLALTGNTGRSGGAHLHLSVEDIASNRVVDPLTLLPPVKDALRPRIDGIFIKPDLKLEHLRSGSIVRGRGEMKLFVKAYDIAEGNFQTGLKHLRISMDDTVLRDYDFSYLIKKNNEYCVAPGYPFDDVYGADKYFYRGGLITPSKARHVFSAEAEDFAGNKTELSVPVYFRR